MILRGQRNQCPSCEKFFNSNASFDKHRTGTFEPPTRRCMTTEEMISKKMDINKAEFWITEKRPEIDHKSE